MTQKYLNILNSTIQLTHEWISEVVCYAVVPAGLRSSCCCGRSRCSGWRANLHHFWCLSHLQNNERETVNKHKYKLKCDAKDDIDVVLKKTRILSFLWHCDDQTPLLPICAVIYPLKCDIMHYRMTSLHYHNIILF